MKLLTTICTAWLLVAGSAMLLAQSGAQAEKLLESARHQEVMDGDLKGAIEQYRKIAAQFAKQPEIAAKALYQLGQCQEKLGQAEARKSYERVVREYGGSQQYAAMARARLAAMEGSASGEVRARLLWDNAVDLNGTATSDGRYLCYTDWDSGDLALRDLAAGQSRRVTNKGGYDKARGEVENCAISPDGKRIAFTWYRFDEKSKVELHLIGADGKDERVLMKREDIDWLTQGSWSPDMKHIAIPAAFKDGGRIVLVSADGGPESTLLTIAQGMPGHLSYSPDGKWIAFHSRARGGSLASGSEQRSLFVLPADGSAAAATELAADASMMGWTPDGKGLLFAREFNGVRNLYRLPVENGKAAGEPNVLPSATGIGTEFVSMTPQGSLLHGTNKRTTDAVTLPLGAAPALDRARTTMPIATFGLGGLSGGIRYSPDGKRVLYTTSTKSVLVRSLAGGSEFTMLPQMSRIGRIEWGADSDSLLISGATSDGPEGVYRVALRSGLASLLFSGKSIWLLAVAPDRATVYYRTRDAGVVARDLKTGAERKLADTPNATFDLKISRDGKKLAVVGFRNIRIVDIVTGQIQTLYQPEDVEASTNPAFHGGDWSADGQQFFVLAGVDNHHRTELWTFPVNGGRPERQRVSDNYRGVWVSPDGTQLATVRWTQNLQLWALENFLPAPPKK